MRPGVCAPGGLKEAVRQRIATYMRRSWGLTPIAGPVNFKFRFYVASFPPVAPFDLDNTYKGYQDIAQEVGIIENDSLVQGHDGSRFVFLCQVCRWGITGSRRKFTKNKKKAGCPGSTKCPERRVDLEITDMVIKMGVYELSKVVV